jgi:predicted TIM-barrel fold metal-dependent hydrolase
MGYLPPNFLINDYEKKVKTLHIAGGAIVSGSFQKFDQVYLINTLKKMGENYFGVANIPLDITSSKLDNLNELNIRAVRFNLKRGGSETINNMVYLTNKLFDEYGWHSEIYVENKHLKDLKKTLVQIPHFSIDHLGLSQSGIKDLFYWAEKGIKIKATGFGRLDFNPIQVMKTIYDINPECLMFGTDLPSTRAREPYNHSHLEMIKDNFSESELLKILYRNAINHYNKK